MPKKLGKAAAIKLPIQGMFFLIDPKAFQTHMEPKSQRASTNGFIPDRLAHNLPVASISSTTWLSLSNLWSSGVPKQTSHAKPSHQPQVHTNDLWHMSPLTTNKRPAVASPPNHPRSSRLLYCSPKKGSPLAAHAPGFHYSKPSSGGARQYRSYCD